MTLMYKLQSTEDSYMVSRVSGLFVPPHFRSQERKVHRENFRSRGTFVSWNITPEERKVRELSLLRTFAPQE